MGQASGTTFMADPIDAIADAFDNELSLRLVGSFDQGGIAEFRLADYEPDHLILPRTEWAILAILADEKLNTPPVSLKWFVSANRLASLLESWNVIDLGVAEHASTIVWRLRKRLNETQTRLRWMKSLGLTPDDTSFAYRLLRRHPGRGYSLGLAAKNLSLKQT